MAKRKDGTALFEAIAKSKAKNAQEGFNAPSWMGRAMDPPAGEESVDYGPAESGPTAPQELTISYYGAAVVVAGAVMLLVGAFVLGRMTAPGQAQPEDAPAANVEQAGGGPAGVVQRQTNARQDALPAATARRQADKYYVVIESISGTGATQRATAMKIVEFLAEHDEPATVVKGSDGRSTRTLIWSLRGFDSTQDQKVKDYARRIEELGQLYRQSGGDYLFLQRKSRSGPLEPWLLPGSLGEQN